MFNFLFEQEAIEKKPKAANGRIILYGLYITVYRVKYGWEIL
ncbi:hypothetical protein [Agriterribacter sp.]|nr:hypothetical protein [Agriterribacter sp.]HRO44522.1 hypothetical protein [Agriterribacter sp.]HRQ16452.1 hypothetical protein [Agriterribacter sp.]